MKHHILLSTVALLAACQTAPVAPAPTETTTVEVIETVAPPTPTHDVGTMSPGSEGSSWDVVEPRERA